MANLMVRMVLQNKSQYLTLARSARSISTSSCSRSSVPTTQVASSDSHGPPTATTGWDKARYPQEELLEIHRRAARTEDPALERRRRLYFVKLIIAIGAAYVTVCGGLLAFLFYAKNDFTWHGAF